MAGTGDRVLTSGKADGGVRRSSAGEPRGTGAGNRGWSRAGGSRTSSRLQGDARRHLDARPASAARVDGRALSGVSRRIRRALAANVLRAQEGAHLLGWAVPERIWLGCSREESAAGGLQLWMLAGKGDAWFLESLTDGVGATYCFTGGDDIPALVSRLLCAPQFSKEALYGSLDMLTGDRADLAIAAQFLGFLVGLRAAFRSRVIHKSLEGWQSDMEALVGDPGAVVEQEEPTP